MTQIEFVEKFISTFANGITSRQKRKIGLNKKGRGYLWFLFKYNMIPCLEGDKARAEYNKVDKTGAIEIQYDKCCGDEETLNLEEVFKSSEGIDRYASQEFYIIGINFSWCYVITHDLDCGPYFCYKPIESYKS